MKLRNTSSARRFVAVLLFALAPGSQAASADPFLTAEHGGPQDPIHSAVASATEPQDGGHKVAHYEVCNRGNKYLTYQWHKPGFQNGLANPLKAGLCAGYSRTIAAPASAPASVLYGQKGQTYEANAYLAKADTWDRLVRQAKTVLYSRGFGKGLLPPAQTLADRKAIVQVTVVDRNGTLVHSVTWSKEVGALAFKLAPVNDAARNSIAAQLRQKVGYERFSQVLTGEDLQRFIVASPEEGLAEVLKGGHFIRIQPNDRGAGGTVELNLGVPAGSAGLDAQPLVVLDHKHRLLWRITLTTTRPG